MLKQTFQQRRCMMANEDMKICSAPLVRKIYIKTRMGLCYTATGMAKGKRTDYTKHLEECGTGTLPQHQWECKMVKSVWKTIGNF